MPKKKSEKEAASDWMKLVKSGTATEEQIDSVGNVIKNAAIRTFKEAKKKKKFKFGQEYVIGKGMTAVEKSKRKADKEKKAKPKPNTKMQTMY